MAISGSSESLSRWSLSDTVSKWRGGVLTRFWYPPSQRQSLETRGVYGVTRVRVLCYEMGSQNARGLKAEEIVT